MGQSEPRSLEALLAWRGGDVGFVYFWGPTPPQPDGQLGSSCLSQWWASPFTVEGVTYQTAEHWMMASKARLFGDEEALATVLSCDDPATAKAAGRAVRGFDRRVWDEHRVDIVTVGNVAKFAAHPPLRDYLLGTGDRVLVEASPVDRIWGIGLADDDPRAGDPRQWQGLNLLGFALMEVRAQLGN